MIPSMLNHKTLTFLFSLFSILFSSVAVDFITSTQSLLDGNTIVSSDGSFELGFFSIGDSKNRYVGIWYNKISLKTFVWVANRDVPLKDSSGKLTLSENGVLRLYNSTKGVIWSSVLLSSLISADGPIAQLLDTGNFVVKNENDEDFIWESFRYPGNMFLPGMKYGINLVTGVNSYLTSWRTPEDPSIGNFTNKIDPNGVPQFFLQKDSVDVFRSGSWNGLRFSGMPNLKPNSIYKFEFVFNEVEVYYKYELINKSVVSRMELNTLGALLRFTWVDRTHGWNLYLNAMMDNCDRYALCGPHGTCDINNSPACGCLKGFVPKHPDDWSGADWSHGCVRKVELSCGDGEDFLKYLGVKLPDTRKSWYNKTMDLKECKKVCLQNCNCTAYADLDVRDGGSGCIHWFGDLIDIREYDETGQAIYVRMAASEIEKYETSQGKKHVKIIIIAVVSSASLVFLVVFIIFFILKKRNKGKTEVHVRQSPEQGSTDKQEDEEEDIELPLFDFATIECATDNFSTYNKLGQGGFGPVYKGIISAGREIAVKRLSKTSRQGLKEFKNEVKCIAKLQHRNLVKLLGCCIQDRERMLIYEYLPNKSLDSFIFNKKESKFLDWHKRFDIIKGIARGLLYLHQDSRLRIIHRDLKASNVLLDFEMNPKISDFGMARIFGGDETEGSTNRVVGTYGYMSPEYQLDGLFSVKSDVFSFGVLLLEIVKGKRNRGFSHPGHKLNLLGHAWRLYKEERQLELIDTLVKDSCNTSEVLRSIHVGLLCVQQCTEDRPNMSTVVLMLSSDMILPQPKEPGFFNERDMFDSDSTSIQLQATTSNQLTLTMLEAR